MRSLFVAGLCLFALPVFAQTCPAPPADPVPRDAARLSWTRPTQYTDNTAISSATVLTYTVYLRSGTTDTAVCTTVNTQAGQTGLLPNVYTWVVSAKVGTNGPEGPKSNPGSKTIQPPTPGAPGTVTVASTRIETDTWTCRDADGTILSRHERQDKAQESCTNFALASLGTSFEMRPSGYRIVAR